MPGVCRHGNSRVAPIEVTRTHANRAACTWKAGGTCRRENQVFRAYTAHNTAAGTIALAQQPRTTKGSVLNAK